MSEKLSVVVDRLSRVPGVRGAAIVDAQAGVPIVAELADDIAPTALAALAGSAFRMSGRATEKADYGPLKTLQLEATDGMVVVSGAGDLLVVAVAEAEAQLGLVRLEAARAAEEIR